MGRAHFVEGLGFYGVGFSNIAIEPLVVNISLVLARLDVDRGQNCLVRVRPAIHITRWLRSLLAVDTSAPEDTVDRTVTAGATDYFSTLCTPGAVTTVPGRGVISQPHTVQHITASRAKRGMLVGGCVGRAQQAVWEARERARERAREKETEKDRE